MSKTLSKQFRPFVVNCGVLGVLSLKNSKGVPNSPTWGYSEHSWSIKKMGALKAPKVSKIEWIVCWCHFTRLPKQNKVSYFKIFKVIKKKAEKTLFLFRIAPPHPSVFCLRIYTFLHASHKLTRSLLGKESGSALGRHAVEAPHCLTTQSCQSVLP